MENDRSYFMRRAAQERSAAAQSRGKAREAHAEMATRYRELAGDGVADEREEPQPAA